jgi:hypothetical protein
MLHKNRPPRPHTDAHGQRKGISYAPSLTELLVEFNRLNTREARVAFVDTWLKVCAAEFERAWPAMYEILTWVENEKRTIEPGESYADFRAYFEARVKRPFTLWMELEQTHHYVTKYAPELIEKTFTEAKAEAARRAAEINEADKANVRPRGRPKKNDDNAENVIINSSGRRRSPTGTSAEKAMRVLRDKRRDIHARVLAGELSPHAGMVEAGFRKKVERRKLSVFDRVMQLLPKLTAAEREAVHEATAAAQDARSNGAVADAGEGEMAHERGA